MAAISALEHPDSASMVTAVPRRSWKCRSLIFALPIDALSDRRIRQDFFDWRDQFASTPRTADYAWSILRRVLSWAYDRGKVSVNHAIKPGRLYDSDRSDLIWLSNSRISQTT